jgi:hypothetical protein
VTRSNSARERLEKGGVAIGVGLRQARTVDIAPAMKTCGFDWLFLDLEHNSMTKLPSRPRLMAIPSGNGSYHLDKRSLKSPRIYNHRRPRSALGVKDLCTTSVIDASSKSLTLLTRFRDSTRTWRKVSFATDASGRIVDSSHCRNLNPRNPGRTSNADVRPPRNLTMSDRRSDSTGRTIHGHYTQELPPTAWQ